MSDQPAGRITLGPESFRARHHMQRCGRFGCAERRAAEGRPPLGIRIGQVFIPSLPVPDEPAP